MQVGTLQAIAHKIELNEDKEARREQVGTLEAIVYKIEPNKEQEAREQVGTLQAVCEQDRTEERKHQEQTWRTPLTP